MTNSIVPEGRYGCPHCTDRFESVGDKKRHLRTSHQDDKQKGTD